jgi:hypothetical protein
MKNMWTCKIKVGSQTLEEEEEEEAKAFYAYFFSLDVSIMSWTNKKKSCIVE